MKHNLITNELFNLSLIGRKKYTNLILKRTLNQDMKSKHMQFVNGITLVHEFQLKSIKEK